MASAQAPEPADEILTVFLQGSSASELTALVEEQGGTVTHDLHIIDAVGAVLSRAQLDRVLASPLVGRHFDDLSVSAEREEPPEEEHACQVGGALELDIVGRTIRWRLFNKGPQPAHLQRLSLNWPEKLGEIQTVRLGDEQLDGASTVTRPGNSALLAFEATADDPGPVLAGAADLSVQFSFEPQSPPAQRDFEAEATFSNDCKIELIPGYEDNHHNFYYNTVVGADALQRNGVTGRGVTVAVIDSGLWEAPALTQDTRGKSRLLARYDAITDKTGEAVFDASGHGTHMASIIAHSGPATRDGSPLGFYKGVAPDVNLVAVKAFDTAGQGDFLDIVRAIQWVVDNRETYKIRVLNLSFAARPRWHYWLDPINQAVMRAWANGITVVAAAGNEGPDLMTIGSPGNLPFVITVGAVTDSWTPDTKDDDYIPDFSSRGPTPSAHIKPDLVAPGGHITGVTRPGSSLEIEHPEYVLRTGEFVMTGSSQATALVSGVAALLLQLEPDLAPDDVKCKLLTSAEPAINRDGLLAYSPFQQGYGYVSATRAVTLGLRGCGNTSLNIQLEIAGLEQSQGPAIVTADGTASLPGLDNMVSPEPAEKGLSSTRKWGVKAHIERQPSGNAQAPPRKSPPPFDWIDLYMKERETIETLSRQAPR